MTLENKYAIVTGSGKGIGLAIVKALLDQGCAVAGWSRSGSPVKNDRYFQVNADVTDSGSVQKAFDQTHQLFNGRIDYLINNAGIAYFGDFEKTPPETWHKMFEVNVHGIFYCSRLVIPVMKEQGSGHIINISSIAGLNGVKQMAGYAATKHAVRGLSHSLYMELRDFGIKVSCIYPGSVKTSIADSVQGMPMATNMMMPEDIAGTVIHLLNTSPNYLTVDVEVRPLKPRG
jgi:NAD(P)-dependent dehydrogenase (short-subunit alcohol dehydrogenase family)